MDPIVVLTMIVRNEAHILARCLDRVRPFIDQYIIVDTGSTDGTKDVARAALEGIPGEVHNFAWCDDYSAARNRALELAEQITAGRRAYAFVVDADDIVSGALDKSKLTARGYSVWFRKKWLTPRLLRLGDGWRYSRRLHEKLVRPGPEEPLAVLEGLDFDSNDDGASWKDPNKFLKHAQILHEELAKDPFDTRSAFYLAQAYKNHGDISLAAACYLRRATMWPEGHPEETYAAYLEAGRAFLQLGFVKEGEKALQAARACFERPEVLYDLSRLYMMLAVETPASGTFFVEPIPAKAERLLAEMFEAA